MSIPSIIGTAGKLVGGITGIPALGWKLATGGAVIVSLGLLVFLGTQMMQNRYLTKVNTQLDGRINAPLTGYVAQVAQATTNVAQLTTGFAEQKKKFEIKASEDARNLAAVSAQLATVQRANVGLRADSRMILATKPQGDTLDARIRDVDARLLETLK